MGATNPSLPTPSSSDRAMTDTQRALASSRRPSRKLTEAGKSIAPTVRVASPGKKSLVPALRVKVKSESAPFLSAAFGVSVKVNERCPSAPAAETVVISVA